MREKNLSALLSNMDILISGPGVIVLFKLKGNFTDSTLWHCSKTTFFQANKSRHDIFCRELKYAMVCDNFESTVSVASPAIPSEIDVTQTDLGKDISDHLKSAVKTPKIKSGTVTKCLEARSMIRFNFEGVSIIERWQWRHLLILSVKKSFILTEKIQILCWNTTANNTIVTK